MEQRSHFSIAAPGLAGFVCDVLQAVASAAERDLRRALRSPYSGVPRADAAALDILAGTRSGIAEIAVRDRLPIPQTSVVAVRRALRAFDDVRAAYVVQGVTASELLATLVRAFELATKATPRERATLDALGALAADLAGRANAGEAVEAGALVDAIARAAETGIAAYVPGGAKSSDIDVPLLEAAPLSLEEARNVKRRRTHFSASSLGAYAECERKWYYRYVCAAVEDKGSSASFYGSAFHWALEKFHQDVTRADAAPYDILAVKLEAWVNTAFERYRIGFATNVEYELQARRAKRTAKRYLTWFVERFRQRPFEVIGTESSAELLIEGASFVGYIDRLDRDLATGDVTVIDYKTGSIAESAAEYRDGVANLTDFQLPFYYWARSAVGDRVRRLTLVPLKDATLPIRPIELEVAEVAAPSDRYSDSPTGSIGVLELERARKRMGEIARYLSEGSIEHFAVARDPEACTFCAYRNACRERPLPLEDRFGR